MQSSQIQAHQNLWLPDQQWQRLALLRDFGFPVSPDSVYCPDLECVVSGFDDLERRRDIVGQGRFELVPDAFGGWRENWRVFYGGRKRAR